VITFLSGFLHSPWMLVGLAALAIPIIIHLLNRRRFDVVDWGAMQFLQISETTRRRLLLEEVVLMLLRMGLLLVLVLGFAGPFFDSHLPLRLGGRSNRDAVLIIDGSASMLAHGEGDQTPFARACEWAIAFLDDMEPGDSVAVLLAREQVVPIVAELSVDRDRARKKVREWTEKAPADGNQTRKPYEPTGSSNWPEAVRAAHAILGTSQKAQREIVLLGDNQKFGWADADTLFRWELLAGELGLVRKEEDRAGPRLWAVNVAGERPARLPNWALAPLRSNRPVVPVGHVVTFKSDIILFGQKSYSPPHRIRLEVDGKAVRDLPPPGGARGTRLPVPSDGKVPFSFTHQFREPGSHLVSVILEPDPPPWDRPHGYEVKDRVPGDNRQDFAVEVLTSIPVLLVDGEDSAAPPTHRNSDFLRVALSPQAEKPADRKGKNTTRTDTERLPDRPSAVQTRVVRLREFTLRALKVDPAPRVIILHDVARLDPSQQEAITGFLGEGGGLLVTLGERAEADFYNDRLYRGGEGWLPARLDSIQGDERKPTVAVRPDPASFTHPALELFRRLTVGGLGEARFPRWWKLETPGKHASGVVAGLLENATLRTPLLVERTFGAGRVLACAVPLDNSSGTNLTDLPSFVPLAHELVYYLAGARSADFNLRPGQPIRYRVEGEARLEDFRMGPPTGVEPLPLSSQPGLPRTYLAQWLPRDKGALLIYEGTREAGVYRLRRPASGTVYYVVPPDAREADLTPCTPEDRDKVARLTGVRYEEGREGLMRGLSEGLQRQDLWWLLLVGVVALLCLEVWMTRRLVMNR
jgi:hypothetical protein